MAKDNSGSIKKVSLDGVPFDVFADANINETGSKFKNESIPTSGRTMRKMIKRSELREGITLACNGQERDILKALSERTTDFMMAYATANGDVFQAQGWIEFENRTTEDFKATIQMHPRTDWTPFLA